MSPVLPLGTSGGTSASPLLFSGSSTGSDTGTTAKPEVPALPAELPLRRDDLFENPWQAVLGGPEVPPFGPVLPVPRAFFPYRWCAVFVQGGSTALWAGTTGPAGI